MLRYLSIAFAISVAACSPSEQQSTTGSTTNQEAKPTAKIESQHAVASAHPLATQAGIEILNQGGNAFDAAIAVAATLGVVEPYSAGIGGGGFWLLYQADKQRYVFVDAREKAPSAAHKDLYLDKEGNVDRDKAVNGALAAGIPGQAAAFVHLANNYGNLPLAASLKDSIQHAQNGFVLDEQYLKLMGFRLKNMIRYPESKKIFLNNKDAMPAVTEKITQKDLARTLTLLAGKGFDGFYKGETAEKLVADVNANGGIWSLEDLANYTVVEREPIIFDYNFAGKAYKFISAPPPSSGGIAMAQTFKILANTNFNSANKIDQIHLMSEAMRRAYKDRAEYLGDPDFVKVPTQALLSDQRAKDYASSIDLDKATSSLELKGPKNIQEGFHTTHLSIVDKWGNRVSATLSINLPFGSAYTAKGTGILLNNEMDDFSAKPGEPNAYGLVGNMANAIEANKRPLSSMTPSMVETDDSIAVLGTPGGSRIITMVTLGAWQYLQNKPVEDWVSYKRFHHQYLPDVIQHEPDTFTNEEKVQLEKKGHALKNVDRKYGNMQAILIDKKANTLTAASDPRGVGQAVVETANTQ